MAAAGTPTLVPSDILAMETPGHFTLSYDGGNLLYIRSTGSDLTPPQNNGTLMYIDVRAATERPLSGPGESVTAYALAPDGNTVVYAAMPRAGGPVSLYHTHVHDTRAKRLDNTSEELAGDFAFLGNDRLIFTGAPAGVDPDSSDVIVADEAPDPVILKTYALRDGTLSPLTANHDVITIWAPSPDGKYVLFKAAPDPESWQAGAPFRYVLFDTRTGQEQELFTSIEGYQDTNQFAWSPDSTIVYIERFANGGLRYPVEDAAYLQAYTPATRTLEDVPLGWDRGLFVDIFNEDIEVNPFNGGAYLLLADGTNPKLVRAVKTSTIWQVSLMDGKDQGNIFAIESDRAGSSIVYNRNSASSPPQLFRAGIDGNTITNPVQLTRLNPDLVAQDLGSSEVTSWNGARGETVFGVVRYPPGYVAGNKYPLVLVIHGGPDYADFDSWRDTWEFPYHLITDNGAVTLSVNYHGSTNFGLDFARSIENGHYYDLPVEDLQTGVNHLAARGIINRSEVGVTGWSNGGILSLALIVKDPTIRAAVSGAGSADDFSQVANTNGIVMNKMYYAKSPYEDPEAYVNISPVFRAEKRRTPLLMMIGTDDIQVDPAGAWVTYRAYKEGSPAPIRFLLFQNQPHHMTTVATQNRKVQEELAWLDQYLLSAP
ncbi:MAG: S9 family peptidase [Methanomicrobiales archaeon HGW-Methanomicrobiales-3]|nr:MAG: S9 family peptidase [Methanomicrobiales archaeon HGW-Methanomicrobiales-3]